MTDRPNVLFIVMDCVRARNTSLHSYHRETTPFLSELAGTATVYKQARAPAPKSLTSHISMFTGLHVEEHKITSRDKRLQSGETIWERLSNQNGYRTGVFSGNTFLTGLDVGLKSAFDYAFSGSDLPYNSALDPSEYYSNSNIQYAQFLIDAIKDGTPIRSFINGVAKLRSTRRGDQYVDEFIEWKNRKSGPWAGVINFMDAHTPYLPPEGFNTWATDEENSLMQGIDNAVWEYQCGHRPYAEVSKLEDLYDGCIRYVDSQIKRLVQHLKSTGEFQDTLLIITADHGEGFGEESRIRPNTRLVGHGESKIHESVLHVPLVIKRPGQNSHKQVNQVVSLTDLPMAIRREMDKSEQESSLFDVGPVLSSATGLRPDENSESPAQAYCDDIESYTGTARAMYTGEDQQVQKQMCWKSKEKTIVVSDARTVKTTKEDETVDDVNQVFDSMDDAGVALDNTGDIDEEVYQRLEELGYA